MQSIADFIEFFNKLLVFHISKGISELHFLPGQNLIIKKGDAMAENPQVAVTADIVNMAVRRLIAVNQDRSFDSIEQRDILEVVGGVLDYDVLADSEWGLEAKTFKCGVSVEDKKLKLVMNIEPDIMLGMGDRGDPSKLSDEELVEWWDDFCTRVSALKNPKPKDIVINPNKRYPYLTVTGGLRPIKDVILAPRSNITQRFARLLVKLAGNPAVDAVVAKNNDSLDTLDLDLAYKTKIENRFRVNVADVFDLEFEHAPLITMRLLPDKPFTMEQLNLPSVIRDMLFNQKMGLCLISGTTGSGKSTSMCAMLDFLLKGKSVNLLTIENPIETVFPSQHYPKSVITQREVGKHSVSQAKSMESAVRQTLNVAMVGEVRNAHDAMMAMELAQSGHLIFATLHAGSVGESIGRIVEMFPADQEMKVREMLASQYKMGIAQTLVKGVHGQTELVLEIMRTNQDIKDLIRMKQDPERRFSMREIVEMCHRAQGTQSLDQCLVKLFNEGKINEDIMMFNSPDPDALVYRQGKLNVKLSSKWDPTGAVIDQAMDTLVMGKNEEPQPAAALLEDLGASLSKLGSPQNN